MAKALVPGGAYLSVDGKTWHDANGKLIDPPAGRKGNPAPTTKASETPPVGPTPPAATETGKGQATK